MSLKPPGFRSTVQLMLVSPSPLISNRHSFLDMYPSDTRADVYLRVKDKTGYGSPTIISGLKTLVDSSTANDTPFPFHDAIEGKLLIIDDDQRMKSSSHSSSLGLSTSERLRIVSDLERVRQLKEELEMKERELMAKLG